MELTKKYTPTMLLDFSQFLEVSFLLFLLGIGGIFFNRKNIIVILMSVEIILLSINLNMVFFSVYLDDAFGLVFALFILTVAAAESAIGLAILVVYYRVRGTIEVEWVHTLKG
jgi:NADH-quinone oxidoreductase subunit K